MERKFGKSNKVEIEEAEIAGRYIVKILQIIKQNTKIEEAERRKSIVGNAREDEKLLKVVKKYGSRETLILGDEKLIQHLGIPNIAFEMRKREMQYHINEIMQYFQPIEAGDLGRRKFLLIIDSNHWSDTEIRNVVWHAKNYYEDIYVSAQETMWKELADFFYEEYGIVIRFITKDAAKNVQVDTIWLFLKQWEECVWDYSFENGYVVAEWETSMKRKRHKIVDRKKGQNKERNKTVLKKLYAGFAYAINKSQLPFEIAVVIANEPNCHETIEENQISIVAIYSVE